MEEQSSNVKFSRGRFFFVLILVLIGIGLCSDLAYIHFKTNFHEAFVPSFCSVSSLIDCDGVATTKYSLSFGVPNALWGMFLYCIYLMLLFVDKIQEKFKNTIFDVFENPRSYIATLSLLQFALSMILAFISIHIIHKICVLCFATYFVDLLIAITSCSTKTFIHDIKITIQDFIKGAKKYFILFIVLLIAFISTLYYLNDSLIFSPKLKKQKVYEEFYQSKKNKFAIKGNVLGNEKALVKIKIYSDYNCPFCRVANIMLHKLAREVDVYIEEVNYPLDTTCNKFVGRTLGGHETSCVYAQYALAAQKQGKFWGAASVLFDTHPTTREEVIEQFKKAHLGLDFDKLMSDANSPAVKQKIEQDIEETKSRGLDGTPAIDINGILYMGIIPYDDLKAKVELARKRELKEKK